MGRTTPDWLDELSSRLDTQLSDADAELARLFPGAGTGRQPVHTVYVPADRAGASLPGEWGAEALRLVEAHGDRLREPDGDLPGVEEEVLDRVRSKLAVEPVEDLRIDFEDGYGVRDDDTEDAAVRDVVQLLLRAAEEGVATPYAGIRFKSFERPTRSRGVRTLALFVTGLHEAGLDPGRSVLTLPKVTSVEQVRAMVACCVELERRLGLAPASLRFEIQIETPQSIVGPDGTALVAPMVHAAEGRCTALHYGTYDYSASCGIAAAYQSMEHPVADHAKVVMQAAVAGTGVWLSDGSTNVLPTGSASEVGAAWSLHRRLVRRSLERGFYQGWDLHPGHLPTRYAATFAFYRSGLEATGDRLRRYVERVGGGVLDEPATARALADFLVRGLDCGALDATEVEGLSGLARPELEQLARPRR